MAALPSLTRLCVPVDGRPVLAASVELESCAVCALGVPAEVPDVRLGPRCWIRSSLQLQTAPSPKCVKACACSADPMVALPIVESTLYHQAACVCFLLPLFF